MSKIPATCHPDRDAEAASGPWAGLCRSCYQRARRQSLAAPPEPMPAAPIVVPSVRADLSLVDAIDVTEQGLIGLLPDCVEAFRRTLASDPAKGFALRAAEVLLRHLPIATQTGSRRLLEGPTKAADANAQTQVVIGLHVSAPGHVTVGHVVGTLPAKPSAE